MYNIRVIISGGGTGGHIFPAIAIANAIKKRFPNSEILFVGANGRMEMKRVPAAGYKIEGLDVAGFDRKNLLRNFSVLWKLQKSLRKAGRIIKDFKPHIAIGVGGFASGPTLRKAAAMGIPTLIQEQNSYAGVTNKLLAEKATRICVAYEGMEKFFPKDKIVMTGNPCRETLMSSNITREEAAEYFKIDPNKKTVLVVGGSLGAQSINWGVLKNIDIIKKSEVQVIWQCGELYITDAAMKLAAEGDPENIKLHDFINRMDYAYKAADLVISRAGASSISELSLLGKPVILVPSPNVAEDHQTKNAMALVEKDAAIFINDKETGDKLIQTALEVVQDDKRLNELSVNISALAQRISDERIVDEIVKIIQKNG